MAANLMLQPLSLKKPFAVTLEDENMPARYRCKKYKRLAYVVTVDMKVEDLFLLCHNPINFHILVAQVLTFLFNSHVLRVSLVKVKPHAIKKKNLFA